MFRSVHIRTLRRAITIGITLGILTGTGLAHIIQAVTQ